MSEFRDCESPSILQLVPRARPYDDKVVSHLTTPHGADAMVAETTDLIMYSDSDRCRNPLKCTEI